MAESPSDYAALLKGVRERENLKLEIGKLQNDIKNHEAKIHHLEQHTVSLQQALQERDIKIEEITKQAEARIQNLVFTLKQKDEAITKLQNSLQAKHRELEEIKSGRGGRR